MNNYKRHLEGEFTGDVRDNCTFYTKDGAGVPYCGLKNDSCKCFTLEEIKKCISYQLKEEDLFRCQ